MRSTKVATLAFVCLCHATSLLAISEESIKAAYLERFAMFIQWPKPVESYNICIYNDTSFAKTLQKSYSSRLFNSHPLNVISLSSGTPENETLKCHILYFRDSKPNQNEHYLNTLYKNNVLLISDDDDDTKKGAMIGFYLQNNLLRFVINQRNLEDAHLSVSYKLLNFATVIEPTGGYNATK
ncbi:MAG: YfiR family protein [Campylobacterales bacterium]|nr:YfiR family protein [Campylobacterales bacterium]